MFNFNQWFAKSNPLRQTLYAWQGEAIVATAIAPYAQGRVHFRGTSWPARCVDAVCLAPGAIVEVIDRHNLTLIVRAVTPQLA